MNFFFLFFIAGVPVAVLSCFFSSRRIRSAFVFSERRTPLSPPWDDLALTLFLRHADNSPLPWRLSTYRCCAHSLRFVFFFEPAFLRFRTPSLSLFSFPFGSPFLGRFFSVPNGAVALFFHPCTFPRQPVQTSGQRRRIFFPPQDVSSFPTFFLRL